MNLLLHIGIHKTATTSIQHFLALNRKALTEHGFYYPKNIDSAYTFNNLASQMVHNKENQTKDFIEKSYKKAEENNAHTVIISAESFYAMTGFFLVLNEPGMDKPAYIAHEEKCIKELRSYCRMFEKVTILCCLRPQEDFATSLYNQLVKSVKGITDNYMEFLNRTALLYDYASHLDLWRKHFGNDNINVFHFDNIKTNPIKYFCENFITPKIYKQTNKLLHSNERLSRDVLEFKREQNKTPYNAAKAFASIQCYHSLAKEFPDEGKWQIYAPLAQRENFFKQYKDSNRHLKQTYGFAELNTMSTMEDDSYPGLSDEKRQAIKTRLNELLSSPSNRTSIAVRSLINALTKHSKFIDQALNPVRAIRNTIRLKLEEW